MVDPIVIDVCVGNGLSRPTNASNWICLTVEPDVLCIGVLARGPREAPGAPNFFESLKRSILRCRPRDHAA